MAESTFTEKAVDSGICDGCYNETDIRSDRSKADPATCRRKVLGVHEKGSMWRIFSATSTERYGRLMQAAFALSHFFPDA